MRDEKLKALSGGLKRGEKPELTFTDNEAYRNRLKQRAQKR
jgi:hypothetical protein